MAHKENVRAWIRGLAEEAGAPDPDQLARGLTLVLDGGLASGVLDADPAAATAARDTAAQLVAASLGCPQHPAGTELRPDIRAFAVNSRRTPAKSSGRKAFTLPARRVVTYLEVS